jgi:hypothetical protein
MTKTILDNARRAARALAKDTGLRHQQALDAIARDRGHRHWGSFRTLPVDVADLMMLSHLDHAWRRRATALRFDYDGHGVTASLAFPGRSKPCQGRRPGGDETRRLHRALRTRFDLDVAEGPQRKDMVIRMDIGHCCDKVPITITSVGDDDCGKVVIGFTAHAGCDLQDASAWETAIAGEERGLLLVQGDAGDRRSALAGAVTRWINVHGAGRSRTSGTRTGTCWSRRGTPGWSWRRRTTSPHGSERRGSSPSERHPIERQRPFLKEVTDASLTGNGICLLSMVVGESTRQQRPREAR